MNYTLSSSQKVDNFVQKINTSFLNVEETTFAQLNIYHTVLKTLNYTGESRTYGDIEYGNYSIMPTNEENEITTLDIQITTYTTTQNVPKYTTFNLIGIVSQLSYLPTLISDAYLDITGRSISASSEYIVSVNLTAY